MNLNLYYVNISIKGELLCKNPLNRLGSINGISDVLNHPWCKKININEVMNKNIKPFLVPNPYVMYFEEFD